MKLATRRPARSAFASVEGAGVHLAQTFAGKATTRLSYTRVLVFGSGEPLVARIAPAPSSDERGSRASSAHSNDRGTGGAYQASRNGPRWTSKSGARRCSSRSFLRSWALAPLFHHRSSSPGLALIEEGVGRVWIAVQDDLSWLTPEVFWRVMEFRAWLHPFDDHGRLSVGANFRNAWASCGMTPTGAWPTVCMRPVVTRRA